MAKNMVVPKTKLCKNYNSQSWMGTRLDLARAENPGGSIGKFPAGSGCFGYAYQIETWVRPKTTDFFRCAVKRLTISFFDVFLRLGC